jgi:cyclopropane-fatty-acyl-phospholipid synthase
VTVPPQVARRIVESILRRLPAGALTVRHSDGTVRSYGRGKPYFTVVVRRPEAYVRLLGNPALRFGECYMDGDLDVEGSLQQAARLSIDVRNALSGSSVVRSLSLDSRNDARRRQRQVQHAYDIGNDFFRLWLDASLTYSCAYFQHPDDTLEVAQANKWAHVHRKLRLEPGQRVLEIGSGWGTALVEAAERYGVSGVGVTLSQEQLARSRELAGERGVADRVEFRLQDYQEIAGDTFDAIYSIGMYEHIGRHHGHRYFDKVSELLRDGGMSVLHTITKRRREGGQAWISRYIFPGTYVPAVGEVIGHLARRRLGLIHAENLRLHYALTLEEWYRRFERHRAEVVEMFDERFARMWTFYLLGAAGSFRYGGQDVFQFTFTKGVANNGLPLTNADMYDATSGSRAQTTP